MLCLFTGVSRLQTQTWCLLSSATRRFHSSSVISAPVSAVSPTASVLSGQRTKKFLKITGGGEAFVLMTSQWVTRMNKITCRGSTHQRRSWQCRPSCRMRKHSGYTPPGSPLRPRTSRLPRRILQKDTGKRAKPQIRDRRRRRRGNIITLQYMSMAEARQHIKHTIHPVASFDIPLASLSVLIKSQIIEQLQQKSQVVFSDCKEKCWRGATGKRGQRVRRRHHVRPYWEQRVRD